MKDSAPELDALASAKTRLALLSKLRPTEMDAINAATRMARCFPAHKEIFAEGSPITEPLLLSSGWAARIRQYDDGRRQTLHILLPGDLIGMCNRPHPVAMTDIVAITDIELCPAPDAEEGTPLYEAYALSAALEEFHLLRQIARLGRLGARERLIDWVLEMHERLTLAGLTQKGRFAMPLTQEQIADCLGLTSVHINRMLGILRSESEITIRGGYVHIRDPSQLAQRIDYRPTNIAAALSDNRDHRA
jgi:CRP-like cAMP-binding protein